MKICLLAAAGNIHTVRWANELCNCGHSVYIVTEKGQENVVHHLDSRVITYILHISGKIGYYLNAAELRSLIKKIDPDVVNVHCASGYGTLSRVARLSPTVLNVWGSDVYSFPNSKLKRKLICKNLRYANALASTSIGMAMRIKELLSCDVPVTVIPFGVDTVQFAPRVKKQSNEFVYGCIKAYTYNYGIDQLIKAFVLLKKKWQKNGNQERHPKLVLYGRGVDKEAFQQLARQLGETKDIEFNDFISNEEVSQRLCDFDVSCFPSLQESFGVSAIESMACGIPVIASKTVGFSEVVEDQKSGLLFDIGNVEALAEHMWFMYCNENVRKQMGEAARQRVLALYDRADNVRELERVLTATAAKKVD